MRCGIENTFQRHFSEWCSRRDMTCFERPSRYYLSAGSYVKGRLGERNFRLTKRERSKKVLSPQRGRQTIQRISIRTEKPNLYIS